MEILGKWKYEIQREFQPILKNQASKAKIFESLFRKLNKEIRTVHSS